MLSYQLIGNHQKAEHLIFIHGAGGSSAIWYKQVKELSAFYNLLLIDLRGHGKSAASLKEKLKKYSFQSISEDIIEVLDYLKIKKGHFIGISLGTILIREIAEKHHHRVQSMVLAGAIMKINLKGRVLIKLGNACKTFIPYMLLYKLFAHVIMPKKTHKQSRNLFIQEAKKLYQKEFIKWFQLTSQLKPILKLFRTTHNAVPTIYIMGEQDHMFLPSIQKLVSSSPHGQLAIIKNSGHVVNIDQPKEFNSVVIKFLGYQVKSQTIGNLFC